MTRKTSKSKKTSTAEFAAFLSHMELSRGQVLGSDLQVALHEAAHVVVARIEGVKVEYCTLKSDSDGNPGHAIFPHFENAVQNGVVAIAGPLATEFATGRVLGCNRDWQVFKACVNPEAREKIRDAVASIIIKNWAAIFKVALALLEHETIDGDQIDAIMAGSR